ncbi:MAG: (2Fe-2S) ferredoxin domain-containing protein [Thermomicrobiales bacterium]
MIGKLRLEIVRRGLNSKLLINNCGTIDLCDIGPNIVIYPDNLILSGVQAKDVKRLVAFLQGEGDMDEFITSPGSVAEKKRHDFYAEAVQHESQLSDEAFLTLALDHGFDSSWIDEQARRGFIARKPAEEGTTLISVTSKSRARYSV